MKQYDDYKIDIIYSFRDLFSRMRLFGDRTAFVLPNEQEITYRQFTQDVLNISSVLSLSKGRIALQFNNKYLFVIAYFGTILSGNTAWLFSPDQLIPDNYEAVRFSNYLNDHSIVPLMRQITDDMCVAPCNHICTVLFSSGTTSVPKAVALSEENILTDLLAGMQKCEYKMNAVYVSMLPYYHIFGLIWDCLAPLYSGGTIWIADTVYSFFDLLPKANPNTLVITPGMAVALYNRISNSRYLANAVGKNLTKIVTGGAGVPSDVSLQYEKIGIRVIGSYGLTECSSGVTANRDNYYKHGSAGIPLSCNEVSILQDGRIRIRGNNVMLGYIETNGYLKENTDHSFTSNDIGYIDKDGFLFVIGRADDLLVKL